MKFSVDFVLKSLNTISFFMCALALKNSSSKPATIGVYSIFKTMKELVTKFAIREIYLLIREAGRTKAKKVFTYSRRKLFKFSSK